MSWRPRVLMIACAAAALLLGGILHLAATAGSRRAPLDAMGAASHAVIAAGAPGVRPWASGTVQEAEAALARASALQDAELDRFRPARDFRPARAAFLQAHALAVQAMHRAVRERRAAGGGAGEALAEAEEAVARATRVAGALGAAGGALLLEARIALEQARRWEARHEYRDAALSAARARSAAHAASTRLLSRVERYRDPDLVRQWESWEAGTVAASRRMGKRAVIVVKELNELRVIDDGRTIAILHADMGSNNADRKLRSGDLATPEGMYRITRAKDAGSSRYYKALLLDYPNRDDRIRLQREIRDGHVPAGTRAGSLIEIHGDGGRGRDWTDGCVALSNPDMDRLFRMVGVGTPVTIIGGRGHGGKFTSLLAELGGREEGAGDHARVEPADAPGGTAAVAGAMEAGR